MQERGAAHSITVVAQLALVTMSVSTLLPSLPCVSFAGGRCLPRESVGRASIDDVVRLLLLLGAFSVCVGFLHQACLICVNVHALIALCVVAFGWLLEGKSAAAA